MLRSEVDLLIKDQVSALSPRFGLNGAPNIDAFVQETNEYLRCLRHDTSPLASP